MNALDKTVEKLGEGTTIRLDSGEVIFKLDAYPGNPIVRPRELGLVWREDGEERVGAVFNGGAEVLDDKIILLPRCHRGYRRGKFFDEKRGLDMYYMDDYVSEVWPLVSVDGVHFTRYHDMVIRGDGTDHRDFLYGIEDIRVVRHGDRYLLVGCGKLKPPFKGENADRIAVYSTRDFLDITYHGIVTEFDTRNAVPFPELVGGRFYMFLRFHPHIHLDYLEGGLEQLLNPAAYRAAWREVYRRRGETLLLEAGRYPHEREKLGPGPQVIKTHRGWLMIYHAVGEIGVDLGQVYGLTEPIKRGYSVCAALLDLEEPRRVLCRTRRPIYIPSAPWELYGNEEYPVDIPAVVFPVGAIARNGKLLLYCGAGDKYEVLLSCSLEALVEYLWEWGAPA